MELAKREAQTFNHEYIGPEHILLGMMWLNAGVAADVLKRLHVDLWEIYREARKLIRFQADTATESKPVQTLLATNVIKYATEEGFEIGHHSYIGTEHLLSGLLREKKELLLGYC
jgi:ATP-dependent Clp protease ATP-binding subunit ClpC